MTEARAMRHASTMRVRAILQVVALLGPGWVDEVPAADAAPTHRVGFQILTRADDRSIAAATIEIRYEGPIEFPMAENLADIWSEQGAQFSTVVLDLDSEGGELRHAETVAAVLREIRDSARLQTLVRLDHECLSACVLVYMQGEDRIAGNATAWMFHGPRRLETNVPSIDATLRYIGLLRDSGVSESFLALLTERDRLKQSGAFWMSGHELFQDHGANIITRLLDPWQPEEPVESFLDTRIRAR